MQDAHSPKAVRSALPIVALVLASVAVVGMVTTGTIPVPTERSRRTRHRRWMHRGGRYEQSMQWDRAASCYQRAVRIRNEDAFAWFEWARMELEAGHPEKAEEICLLAKDIPGMDPLDLLTLRATAAWSRTDLQTCRAHVAALADQAPEMAQHLVEAFGIDPDAYGIARGQASGRHKPPGGIDGYA